MDEVILMSFGPDRDALLRALVSEVDDQMLRSIADADYGYKSDEHFTALLTIRDHFEFPIPLPWEPREVLELTRWSDPSDSAAKSESDQHRDHVECALACASLLRAGADQESLEYLNGEDATLAQLLNRLRFFEAKYLESALSFISFRILNYDNRSEERPYFIFAALWLAVKLGEKVESASKVSLARWLIEDEERQAADSWLEIWDPWLFGRHTSMRADVWRLLGDDLLVSTQGEDKELTQLAQQITIALKTGVFPTPPASL